jgi:hypothetical protein
MGEEKMDRDPAKKHVAQWRAPFADAARCCGIA